MARPVTHDATPRAGYWTTDNYDDAVNFIVQYLEQEMSIKLVIHTSAIFLKDGEEIIVHIQTKVDTILDIDHLQIQDFFGDVFSKLTDPDDFPSVAGSGMTFIRMHRWWFSIAPCQPNNNATPTERNTIGTEVTTVELDATDGPIPDLRVVITSDNLLGCIALWHTYVPGQNKRQRRLAVRRWLKEQRWQPSTTTDVHISELPAWHEEVKKYNLVVFNRRGNVLYRRAFNTAEEYIPLFYSDNRRYKLIIRQDAFLNDRSREVRGFCYKCLKYHTPEVCEVLVETVGSNDTVRIVDKPNCIHKLVCYADFEAYIAFDGRHIPSGYCWCAVTDRTLIKVELRTVTDSEHLEMDFVNNICTFIRKWSVTPDVRTTNCLICGTKILSSEKQVESVDLALKLLDGYDFKGHRLHVERAKFQMKGSAYDPSLKPKKRKRKDKERLKKMQEKLFDWRPEKMRGERSKHERVVIVKNLFEPTLFDKDVSLLLEYQQDLREECSKCGDVRRVVIYDRHPEGVAQITFREPEEADACVLLLNGRWFCQRKLTAEIWDGKTKYKIGETDSEIQQRLSKWDEFLESEEALKKAASKSESASGDTKSTKTDSVLTEENSKSSVDVTPAESNTSKTENG